MADRFEPIRIYDAPDVIFTQAMQGELSYRTVMNTMLRPNDLSIEERDSFADDLKDAMGNHGVTNAMVDVMKNPFFWLLFVTSPVAHPALRAGKNIIYDKGPLLGAYMKQSPGLFGWLQVLTANEYFSGTSVGAAIGHISKTIDQLQRRLGDRLSTPAHDVMARHKLWRGLYPEKYASKEKQETVHRLRSALQGAMERSHEDVVRVVAEATDQIEVWKFHAPSGIPPVGKPKGKPTILKGREAQEAIETHNAALRANPTRQPPFYIRYVPLESGEIPIVLKPRTIKGWGGDDPFQVLEDMGAMPLFKAYDEIRRDYFIRMFMRPWKQGVTKDIDGNLIAQATHILDDKPYVVNPDSLMKMYRANKNPLFTKTKLGAIDEFEPIATRGMEIIKQLMSKPVAEALWMGMEGRGGYTITSSQFVNMLTKIIDGTADVNTYVPRNVLDVFDPLGKKIAPDAVRMIKEGPLIYSTARASPRSRWDSFKHPDDLEAYKRTMHTPEGGELDEMIGNMRDRIGGRLGEADIGSPYAVMQRIDPITAMERYTKDMNESYALFIAPVTRETRDHQRKYWTDLPKEKKREVHGPVLGGTAPSKVGVPFDDIERSAEVLPLPGVARPPTTVPMGGFNYADHLWSEYNLLGGAHAKEMLADVLIPTTLGRLTSAQKTGRLVGMMQQGAAKMLRGSPIRGWMEESGEWGKNFMRQVDQVADASLKELVTSRDFANWFYVTHLGFNMSSVLLNAMQPLLLGGPAVGMKNLIYGYKEGFRELGNYYRMRKGLPIRISDASKEDLIRKSFKWSNYEGHDLLDIHPNIHHTVDAIAEGKMSYIPPSWTKYLMMDAPMKMFEKAEWLNRLVMSHATENMMRTAGRGISEADIARNVHDFVRQTQYGAHVMNTPLAFLPHAPKGGGGQAKNLWSDPTMRQFMTFPLRTVTAFAYAPRLMSAPTTGAKRGWEAKLAGSEARKVGGVPLPGDLTVGEAYSLLNANMRAMGYGAVTYSLMKNMVNGADVSRGLYPQAALDIIEGDRFVQGEESAFPVMVPPVVDIASDFLQWITGPADTEILSRWVSRVAPVGVAGRRALSLIPSPDTDYALGRLARQMQGFYVGWDEPRSDGLVPVYKSDGTLVTYQKPTTMILRALGMDMRKFASDSQMDRWLARNRDESSRIKREWISSILNGDYMQADELNENYEKKYGIPIRLTRQQLSSQMRTRTLTRTERLLDRMSPDIRERYISAIQHKAPQLGLTPEQLGKSTATQRTEAGAQRPAPLTPEAQKYLEAYMTEDPSGVFRRFGSDE